jgi:hypothetical protein
MKIDDPTRAMPVTRSFASQAGTCEIVTDTEAAAPARTSARSASAPSGAARANMRRTEAPNLGRTKTWPELGQAAARAPASRSSAI